MSQQEPTINLTPLIDVLFVVLILFIVIAPMIVHERVRLPRTALPQTLQTVQEIRPITLSVTKDNQVLWGKEPVQDWEDLKMRINRLSERERGTTPLLFHDHQAYFGTFHQIKEIFEEAGFQDIDVAIDSNPLPPA